MSILPVLAEDGHSLWLRNKPNAKPANVIISLPQGGSTSSLSVAADELRKYWHGSQQVQLLVNKTLAVSDEAYNITVADGRITISAPSSAGVLYGAYALLRQQATGNVHNESSAPVNEVRILNHWDNPDGTVERGFSGRSIFWNNKNPKFDVLMKEYARANASIGINATVLNNVNAKPLMLSKKKIAETKHIADLLRPYNIKVYLAVNFASPKALGNLDTADPLDSKVIEWWKKKADEIYASIPDFGGFLVKANSEGEPGPMDYGRTHVDGANMLADALAPHHGIVMWRSFVYSSKASDRASQAYEEFMPYDGQFRDNVIIQIKNGPVDFQPREPASPLFFNMKKTRMMPEFQITQEYLGESIHTAFLAPMWKETLEAVSNNTSSQIFPLGGRGTSAFGGWGASAVANVGTDRNWCGSVMAQANWYAFGRLAWDENLGSADIAAEWLKQTFTTDEAFVTPMTQLLIDSRETVVRYMMPLGLHHIFAGNHHYGPEPWYAPEGCREDWLPRYYHKASADGIGFDRTVATGSGNTAQYPEPLRSQYENIGICPENLLLWFHHVSWDYRMKNGNTLWNNLCLTYDQGVREAEAFVEMWKAVKPYVDAERYAAQLRYFDRQAKDAWWWRDACLLYFQTFSQRPFPSTSPAPRHKLDDLMKYKLDMDNYSTADITKLP